MNCCEAVIFLDGVDRTGKSTLRQNLVKFSNGKYYVADRSPISQIAYSRIYNRNIDEEFFFDWMFNIKMSSPKVIFVYLYAPIKVLEQRFIATDEKDLKMGDYKKHIAIFNKVVEEAKNRNINILKFDSSKYVEIILAQKVAEKIEDLGTYCHLQPF